MEIVYALKIKIVIDVACEARYAIAFTSSGVVYRFGSNYITNNPKERDQCINGKKFLLSFVEKHEANKKATTPLVSQPYITFILSSLKPFARWSSIYNF